MEFFSLKTWEPCPDGETLHRDISGMGKGHSGKWMPNMLADNGWILIRETPTGEYKRQRR
jgi:hypothetical protein